MPKKKKCNGITSMLIKKVLSHFSHRIINLFFLEQNEILFNKIYLAKLAEVKCDDTKNTVHNKVKILTKFYS